MHSMNVASYLGHVVSCASFGSVIELYCHFFVTTSSSVRPHHDGRITRFMIEDATAILQSCGSPRASRQRTSARNVTSTLAFKSQSSMYASRSNRPHHQLPTTAGPP